MERPAPRPLVARALATSASLVVAAGLVATVGISSASAAKVNSAKVKHGPTRQCTAVGDVLADGPTTDADPVGYAEAQVLPLKQLKLADPSLKKAVAELDSAYKAYSDSNGSPKTAVKVTAAEARVDAICPTAAP